jgi:hypothetical protein
MRPTRNSGWRSPAHCTLQIDDPPLVNHWALHPKIGIAQRRKWASASVEVLNLGCEAFRPNGPAATLPTA